MLPSGDNRNLYERQKEDAGVVPARQQPKDASTGVDRIRCKLAFRRAKLPPKPLTGGPYTGFSFLFFKSKDACRR